MYLRKKRQSSQERFKSLYRLFFIDLKTGIKLPIAVSRYGLRPTDCLQPQRKAEALQLST